MSIKISKTLKKVVIIFLITTLTYANFILIGNNIMQGLISYALDDEKNPVEANQELIMNKICEINGEQKRVIQVAVQTGIESENYPIKESTLTLNANIVEGIPEIVVANLNKNSYTSGTWVVEAGKLKISLTNENETLESKDKGLDKFLVTYIFPESEIETIKQPLEKVEITTYGNEVLTKEFEENNFEDINIEKNLLSLNIENKDIHKTTIKDGQVDFKENLVLDLGYRKDISNIIMEDEETFFYNNNAQKNEEIVLKYKTTTISKENLFVLLGEDGTLRITDMKTNKVLVELNSKTLISQEQDVKTEQKFTNEETNEEEVRSYVTVTDETIEIEYVADMTNFKLELTNIRAQSENTVEPADFTVTNTKTISNINDVEKLDYLQEKVKYTIGETEKTVESKITFKDTITIARLDLDNKEWVAGQTNTVNFTITLDTSSEKTELYVDPIFLIELPSSVKSVNTANSSFTINNNNGAFTNKRVFVITLMERKVVVINLGGSQTEETIANGDTTIDLTLELNLAEDATSENEETTLYYQNNTVTSYENEENVGITSKKIQTAMESEPKEDIEETIQQTRDLSLFVDSSSNKIILPESELTYTISIFNSSTEEIQNLTLKNILPEGVTLVGVLEKVNDEETEVDYKYDNGIIEIHIDKIDAATKEVKKINGTEEVGVTTKTESKIFKIIVKTNKLEEGIFSKEIKNTVKLYKEDSILEEKETTNIISNVFLTTEIDQIEETINESEEIVLGLKLKNQGLINATGVNISLNIPDEISLKRYSETLLENFVTHLYIIQSILKR